MQLHSDRYTLITLTSIKLHDSAVFNLGHPFVVCFLTFTFFVLAPCHDHWPIGGHVVESAVGLLGKAYRFPTHPSCPRVVTRLCHAMRQAAGLWAWVGHTSAAERAAMLTHNDLVAVLDDSPRRCVPAGHVLFFGVVVALDAAHLERKE